MPKRKLPPDAVLIEMYQSGLSCPEIAEKLGDQGIQTKAISVFSRIRMAGIQRRTPQEVAQLREKSGRARHASYWLGKKQPPDLVEKRVSKIRGENHYMWKGGTERRPYRKKIVKESCAACGSRQNLSIHHIDLDHYNDADDNLQVLCVSCHMSLHKQAYWDAYHKGEMTPKSNGPVGWTQKKEEVVPNVNTGE